MKKHILAGAMAIMMLAATGCTETTAPPETETTVPTSAPTTPPTTVPTEVPDPPEPDTVSVLDFLTVAAQPVGSTMYVWGGGWNEADTGAGIEAVTLGLSAQWAAFAAEQDASYDYKDTRYQIHDGLDCSGYVGWAVYNIMETEDGREGYVCSSTKMALQLSERGLGEYISAEDMDRWLPGDILSMKGHVWISVGMCDDGSVLLLHASPPGVIFCGTTLPDGSSSQAVALAERVMSQHHPDWYRRFPDCARSHSYLTGSSAMRWGDHMLSDEEGIRSMTAEEVIRLLYG